MAQVLLTYDVSKRHPDVKAALRKRGFFDYWNSNDVTYNLPNTTMFKQGEPVTSRSVKEEMEAVVAELNRGAFLNEIISLQRCMAVEFTNWSGITGLAHGS